jgi:hypothetical protein
MQGSKFALFAALAGGGLLAAASAARAAITVDIGVAPVCPYGYYDFAPYNCAAPGYYGPEWFVNGAFIGAGPWFHGPEGFHGHVNNRLDPRRGYHGALPGRGERPDPHAARAVHFRGNEQRDGHGDDHGDDHGGDRGGDHGGDRGGDHGGDHGR